MPDLLEHEIDKEIKKLEKELKEINKELNKLYNRASQLLRIKKRNERDLNILKSHSSPNENKKNDLQTNLIKY